MKTSEAAALHPIKELAKHPYGQEVLRNYGEGKKVATLRWNPRLAKHGLFELEHEGKILRFDAEEFRTISRVF